ncbi:MAG: RagB/SusD family nutrient uptake outer membrane protein [Proteiniphilum sp.]|nr:RagB/SusD family nutrient uptake outer membrane protein [Proteiniphilum sp.]
MKNIIYKVALLITFSLLIISCEDFLDKEPNNYSSSGFYQSEAAIKDGVSGIYNSLYINLAYNLPFSIMLDHWTGLAMERAENSTIGAGGALNPDNGSVLSWWSSQYGIIARSNSVIKGSEPYIENLGGLSKQYLAEARVLRAYAYYNLISTYGNVPFFKEPVSVKQYSIASEKKEVILDFILSDLDLAVADLPWVAVDRGRVDKSFAYGLKARAALLGGSLNYGDNANKYFKASADAANSVIGQRSLANKFDDLFNVEGQSKADVRNEMIFELMYSDQGSTKIHMIGFGQVSRCYGQTGRHPSRLLADTYECKDGKRIDESPLYDPKNPSKNRDPRFNATLWMHGDTIRGNTRGTDAGRIMFIADAYNPTTKFYNYDTGKWEERTNTDLNSGAAWTSFANAGLGYMWKKFSNTQENISKQTCNVPLMRYAEVLLTYAEAKIELGELDNSVYDAINQVRNRSKMPNVSVDRQGNQEKMRQLVRRERKVELILEGLHFVDMRRWKIGDLENGGPSYGFPIALTKDKDGYITSGGYQDATQDMIPNFKKTPRHDLNDIANYDTFKDKLKVRDLNRFWKDQFYLFPIPQTERDRNENIDQNDGY